MTRWDSKKWEKMEEEDIKWIAVGLLETYWPVQVRYELYEQFPYVPKYVIEQIISEAVESVRRQEHKEQELDTDGGSTLWVVKYVDEMGLIQFMDHNSHSDWEKALHDLDLVGLEIIQMVKFGGEWE